MKKISLFSILLLVAAIGYAQYPLEIDAENFPDSIFRSYVLEHFDADSDGSLGQAECEAVKTIEMTKIVYLEDSSFALSSCGVRSLQGVEHFSGLDTLEIWSDVLYGLDLSQNKGLRCLSLMYAPLENLDLSQNQELRNLNISSMGLQSLDLNSCPDLESLSIWLVFGIPELDLSQCPNLSYLSLEQTGLTDIELGHCPDLKKLSGTVIEKQEVTLPTNHDKRINIFVKKEKATANIYPRLYAKIKKKPL